MRAQEQNMRIYEIEWILILREKEWKEIDKLKQKKKERKKKEKNKNE